MTLVQNVPNLSVNPAGKFPALWGQIKDIQYFTIVAEVATLQARILGEFGYGSWKL